MSDDRPRAAPNYWPYHEHRSMAEVRRDREYEESKARMQQEDAV